MQLSRTVTGVVVAPDPLGVEPDAWDWAERLLLGLVTVLVAARLNLEFQLTLGNALVLLLAPAWLPHVRRYATAAALLGLGAAAAVAGVLLTYLAAEDHSVGLGTMLVNTILLVGLLSTVGFLLWARERLGDGLLITLVGLGTVLGVSHSDPLYATNPWKFGYATGVTVLVLGLAHLARSRAIELVLVAVLMVIAAATDSRSAFGVLMLTAALLAWQLRPLQGARLQSAVRGALGLGVAAAVAYFVGGTLIQAGYFGAETRERSIEQIDASGSLIVGGRPEIAATGALFRDHVWGYGSGTHINHHDLIIAKNGMAAVGYDPDNGYVERYMFGTTYELHSVLADLWSRFGVVGLVLGLLMAFVLVRWMGRAVTSRLASAALLYVAIRTSWNLAFSPWYSSIGLLAPALALFLFRHSDQAVPIYSSNVGPGAAERSQEDSQALGGRRTDAASTTRR